MKRLTIVLFLLLSAVLAFAQEPLSGIVVDDAGKALAGANVMAYGPDGKVLSFAVTGHTARTGRCSALPSQVQTGPFS